MPTSLIAPVVSAGVGFGLNQLAGGGGSSGVDFSVPGFNAGGLSATFGGSGYNVSPSAGRMAQVGGISNTFGAQADTLGNMRGLVAPGISGLRAARLASIENSRSSAIGNLRDNLARRRVLGSSFANDAIARGEAEFSQQKQAAEAESFLQEMELTTQLMQQEFTARRGQFQTNLDEMNLEANLAATLAGKATDILGKNAAIEALLNQQSLISSNKFMGESFRPIAKAAGKAAGNFFSRGSSGPDMAGGIWPA